MTENAEDFLHGIVKPRHASGGLFTPSEVSSMTDYEARLVMRDSAIEHMNRSRKLMDQIRRHLPEQSVYRQTALALGSLYHGLHNSAGAGADTAMSEHGSSAMFFLDPDTRPPAEQGRRWMSFAEEHEAFLRNHMRSISPDTVKTMGRNLAALQAATPAYSLPGIHALTAAAAFGMGSRDVAAHHLHRLFLALGATPHPDNPTRALSFTGGKGSEDLFAFGHLRNPHPLFSKEKMVEFLSSPESKVHQERRSLVLRQMRHNSNRRPGRP